MRIELGVLEQRYWVVKMSRERNKIRIIRIDWEGNKIDNDEIRLDASVNVREQLEASIV